MHCLLVLWQLLEVSTSSSCVPVSAISCRLQASGVLRQGRLRGCAPALTLKECSAEPPRGTKLGRGFQVHKYGFPAIIRVCDIHRLRRHGNPCQEDDAYFRHFSISLKGLRWESLVEFSLADPWQQDSELRHAVSSVCLCMSMSCPGFPSPGHVFLVTGATNSCGAVMCQVLMRLKFQALELEPILRRYWDKTKYLAGMKADGQRGDVEGGPRADRLDQATWAEVLCLTSCVRSRACASPGVLTRQ